MEFLSLDTLTVRRMHMDFHYTVETSKTIDETITALELALKEHQFGILWRLDLPVKLKEKGVDSYTNPYQILEVCNPHEAARVLNRNELVGYFLPCKIVVYLSEGKTKIGFPKPSILVGVLEDDVLKDIADGIEMTLKSVLDKAAA
jgi:uncharacterized protein (DUF302 family)